MEQKHASISTESEFDRDSIINLDLSNKHLDTKLLIMQRGSNGIRAFWKEVGDNATVVIPGWQKMSYSSDPDNLCWFLEPEFASEALRLHRVVNNAVTDSRHLIVGVGSTQLVHATLFALSSTETRQPVNVVSPVPYYSMYAAIVDLMKSGLFRWAGDAATYKGDDNFIEIVCSPNNPDGASRDAVLGDAAGKRVHDLAYYWPQYTPMREAADHDIMLFTVSKATGHAGTRIGWALVKDETVSRKMVEFIELNSIGVSKDSQVRAARILKVISDGYELPNPEKTSQFFHFGRRVLADRWRRLREAVDASGRFSLPRYSPQFCMFAKEHAETYSGFAWIKCEDKRIEDCEEFFKAINILTMNGKRFGAGTEFARISMLDRDANFDIFIKRISSSD